jgi:hypothetical protein
MSIPPTITPAKPRHRRKRRLVVTPEPTPPPPGGDTLVTSVMAAPANQALWTFDHDVAWDGITDDALRINGASPTGMLSIGPTQIVAQYAVQPVADDAWAIDATPTHVTSPGRTIPVPQGGTVIAGP